MSRKESDVEGIDEREVLTVLKSANAALSEAAREIGEAADAGLEVDESYFDEGGEGYEAQRATFDLARKLERGHSRAGVAGGEAPAQAQVVEVHVGDNGEAYLCGNGAGFEALAELLGYLLSYKDVSSGPITSTTEFYTAEGDSRGLRIELAGDWRPPRKWGAKKGGA